MPDGPLCLYLTALGPAPLITSVSCEDHHEAIRIGSSFRYEVAETATLLALGSLAQRGSVRHIDRSGRVESASPSRPDGRSKRRFGSHRLVCPIRMADTAGTKCLPRLRPRPRAWGHRRWLAGAPDIGPGRLAQLTRRPQ